jgi:hypothetical protein
MRRKLTIPKLMFVLGLFVGVPAHGQDKADYCAFEVVVKSPAGAPVVGIEVSEIESGQVYAVGVTDQQGISKICDAPEGLIDLHVGAQLCGAVTVAHLAPYWMVTRRIDMIYKNCQGDDFLPQGGCLLTIRVRDGAQAPLPGVNVNDPSAQQPSKGPQTNASDQFGRIFRFLAYGDTGKIELRKDGYQPQAVAYECRPGRSFMPTRTVILEKRP